MEKQFYVHQTIGEELSKIVKTQTKRKFPYAPNLILDAWSILLSSGPCFTTQCWHRDQVKYVSSTLSAIDYYIGNIGLYYEQIDTNEVSTWELKSAIMA